MKAIDVVFGLLALPWVLFGFGICAVAALVTIVGRALLGTFFLLGPWILLYLWLTGQFQ